MSVQPRSGSGRLNFLRCLPLLPPLFPFSSPSLSSTATPFRLSIRSHERKQKTCPLAYDHFSRKVLSPELQAGIESYVSRYEKMLKSKIDNETKLVGLEALVQEELEKHLILSSNR